MLSLLGHRVEVTTYIPIHHMTYKLMKHKKHLTCVGSHGGNVVNTGTMELATMLVVHEK